MDIFFFNDTATTEIYTLSLHDALPICVHALFEGFRDRLLQKARPGRERRKRGREPHESQPRSEEHTSELQSRQYLVCRLLLEKKKKLTSRSFNPTILKDTYNHPLYLPK